MKITQISVTYGRKFNLDDYESMHVETTYWAEVDEDEEFKAEQIMGLWELAKTQVKYEAMPVLKVRDEKRRQLNQQVTEAYGGEQ